MDDEYNHQQVERKWQAYWRENQVFKAVENSGKPKYYVLDMFPYPSGAGLHVGHPLGYIASDIIARYRRHLGFEVLHPMGFDAFGLPAEQFAIDTGNHPATFTDANISRYRNQLEAIGFSFDWSREVKTSDPGYYKWTQWIFTLLFNSWYNKKADQAEPIEALVQHLANHGTEGVFAAASHCESITADQWASFNERQKQEYLLSFRLAYQASTEVNWCPALGTVLSNDEVKDGLSERGGHPVVRQEMKQWFLRITAYSDRLLNALDTLDWPNSIKEIQRNWIGKSTGAVISFDLAEKNGASIKVFSTRPDTIFGCTFIVLAADHPLAMEITTAERRGAVEEYISNSLIKSTVQRQAAGESAGVFTGSFALHPFTSQRLPIFLADYVLKEYGTGAIMAVPAHDERDYRFAAANNLPIPKVVDSGGDLPLPYEAKEGKLINSSFLDGFSVPEAITKTIAELEKRGVGQKKINYRLKDANFGRQRYWGEPIPIIFHNQLPQALPLEQLPLVLPDVESYKPTGTGKSPLAGIEEWVNLPNGDNRETDTMPGWAGSSWYWLRFMDPQNSTQFCSPQKEKYWGQVDIYIGGPEHATGHLLYSRFWANFLYDRCLTSHAEPFKKLINQGMIQGRSSIAHRIKGTDTFISAGLIKNEETTPYRMDVSLVKNDRLDIESARKWRADLAQAEFVLENGEFICTAEVEKMSKSKYNVINPEAVIDRQGADVLRMYEMFLGPVEASKPWSTEGIDGTTRFARKFWSLFHNGGAWNVSDRKASNQELRALHTAIKKISEDIDRFSLNTCISQLMICINELRELKCNAREILEPLVILLSPFAPHMAEELWQKLGHQSSISTAAWPEFKPEMVAVSNLTYPVSIGGKVRFQLALPVEADETAAKDAVLGSADFEKWADGKSINRFVFVPKRMINVVLSS